MIKIIENSVNGMHDVSEACADSPSDLTAPENQDIMKHMGFGSRILVIETGTVYMTHSKGEWKAL